MEFAVLIFVLVFRQIIYSIFMHNCGVLSSQFLIIHNLECKYYFLTSTYLLREHQFSLILIFMVLRKFISISEACNSETKIQLLYALLWDVLYNILQRYTRTGIS